MLLYPQHSQLASKSLGGKVSVVELGHAKVRLQNKSNCSIRVSTVLYIANLRSLYLSRQDLMLLASGSPSKT